MNHASVDSAALALRRARRAADQRALRAAMTPTQRIYIFSVVVIVIVLGMTQFYLPLFLLMRLFICLLLVQFLLWVLCRWLHRLFLLLPQKICNRWFQLRLILLLVSFSVMLTVRCFVCLVLLCIVRLILIVQSLRLI